MAGTTSRAAPTADQRAVIYARISADPEGRELGVQRQEEDARALAERHGLDVVGVYVDNDVSASTRSTKPRPQYAAMLDAVRGGQAGTIVAYSNSRLTRRPREVEDLLELHARTGVRIITVVSGEDDLATADGRMVARIKAGVDAAEAERVSERTRRAKAQARAAGHPNGGARRAYGFEKDGVTLREAEAELLRVAARGILAGRPLLAVAQEFAAANREAGGDTYRDDRNAARSLSRTLRRARVAGMVEHDGEVVGVAAWPAILDRETWEAVRVILSDPARRSTPGPARRWLGSGLYRCVCGATMYVSSHKGKRYYVCSADRAVMRSQALIDAAVVGIVHGLLRDPRIVAGLAPRDPNDKAAKADRERSDALRARLATAEADYRAGLLTGRQLHETTTAIEAEQAAITRRQAARLSSTALGALATTTDPAAAFDAAPLDRQRAVVAALLTVTIGPSLTRGRPRGWRPGQPYANLSGVEIVPVGAGEGERKEATS